MHVFAHLLLLASWLGSFVVFGVSLNDLTPSKKCILCRSFADAVYYTIDHNTPNNEMQSVAVGRCQLLLGGNYLVAYCSPFNAAYFNTLLVHAQNGESTTSMCRFLCSGLASQQSYGWQQNAQVYENSLTGGAYRESSDQSGHKCDMCRDIAGKLITTVQSFHGNTDVTPESICREIEACPEVMSSRIPSSLMEKLVVLLQRFEQTEK